MFGRFGERDKNSFSRLKNSSLADFCEDLLSNLRTWPRTNKMLAILFTTCRPMENL